MAGLPEDVRRIKQVLSRDPLHELTQIAEKLIAETPELATMWRTLERWKQPGDPVWIQSFLSQAADASNLPLYHYKSVEDRRELSENIADWAKRLARALTVNGLDAHLVHINWTNFHGFYNYEDFGESNQASLDEDGVYKLKLSEAIEAIAKRAQEKIADEPLAGKVGANVRAIRFVRIIATRNRRVCGKPLNAVTAAAANAIFGTSYKESDIRNLLNR